MAKNLVKEGMTFALGLVKIGGQQFNGMVKQLESKNKVSSREGEKMVYKWVATQQQQLRKMKTLLKKEALHTKMYSAKELAEMNRLIKKLSKEIERLQKKKEKAEAADKKKSKKKPKKKAKKKKK